MDSLVTFGKLTRGGGLVTKDAVFRGAFNQASNIGALIPETGPRPSLSDLARHLGCRLDELSEDFLSALFQGGDARLIDWIDDRGERLSKPLATVVQLFNPDAIVVGGFFPRAIYRSGFVSASISALSMWPAGGR
ncbi:hypothetical protein [Rhizobium lentis]|uniref:ROK family protein n=1 Tax=Rhizobium lentis TaxID=1138194 RepID=A0A9Q3QY79_9HYPH|nr:hypothetical protein [Rhizobium lentis]MBX5010579.1 ROK family protein [Rhizobium lentis]MBX5025639.1 ROK family protein [Rhizobium lentis]